MANPNPNINEQVYYLNTKSGEISIQRPEINEFDECGEECENCAGSNKPSEDVAPLYRTATWSLDTKETLVQRLWRVLAPNGIAWRFSPDFDDRRRDITGPLYRSIMI